MLGDRTLRNGIFGFLVLLTPVLLCAGCMNRPPSDLQDAREILEREGASDEVLECLFRFSGSSACEESVYARYSGHDDPRVRAVVAFNRGTPVHILRSLSSDRSDVVRSRVAVNPSIPKDVLKSWMTEEPAERDILANLASNPGLEPSTLVELYRKFESPPYYAFIANPNTPDWLRRECEERRSAGVR